MVGPECSAHQDVDNAEGEVHNIGEVPNVLEVSLEALLSELDALVADWPRDAQGHAKKEVYFLMACDRHDVNPNNVSYKHRNVENVEEACCSMMPLAKSSPFEIHEIQNGLTTKQLQFWTLLEQIKDGNAFVNQDVLAWVLSIFNQVLSDFGYQVDSVLDLMRFGILKLSFAQVLILKVRIRKDILIVIPNVKDADRKWNQYLSVT